MTRVHTRYSEIVPDATGDIGQRVWDEEHMGNLERSVRESKRMLTETIDKHYESDMYTLQYDLPDRMVEDTRWCGALSV